MKSADVLADSHLAASPVERTTVEGIGNDRASRAAGETGGRESLRERDPMAIGLRNRGSAVRIRLAAQQQSDNLNDRKRDLAKRQAATVLDGRLSLRSAVLNLLGAVAVTVALCAGSGCYDECQWDCTTGAPPPNDGTICVCLAPADGGAQ